MYQNHSVGVVVPAYNEEGLVGDVLQTMPEFVDSVYAVDDGSTDNTWQEIKANSDAVVQDTPVETDWESRNETSIFAIQHEENSGNGAAVKTGYQQALADDIDVTAVMAGDGQMDPELLDAIVDPIIDAGADYTKGNRLLYREYREDMTTWRFVGNHLLTILNKIASGYWKAMDPQNGYAAISKNALRKLLLDDLYDRYGFQNDLMIRMNVHGLRVADVAMPAKYGEEESHIRYYTFIPKVSLLLLHGFLWRMNRKYMLFDFHPLIFIFYTGTLSLLVTPIMFLKGSLTASFMSFFFALVGIFGGLILDYQHNLGTEFSVDPNYKGEEDSDSDANDERQTEELYNKPD